MSRSKLYFHAMSAAARIVAAMAMCAALFLSACASTPKNAYESFTLAGMVYDRSGTPVNGMKLILKPAEGATDKGVFIYEALSDFSGRFSFLSIVPGVYVVTAVKTGCEPYSASVHATSPSQILYISILSAEDIVDLAEEAMRASRWIEADAYVSRAIALNPRDPEARYIAAACKSTKLRPDRDAAGAIAILEALIAEGYAEAPVTRLLSDLKTTP
jgi:protocatechuate 3,4-dioxygenase beta subunit